MPVQDLRQSAMMSHLLDALDRGEDIGHYGRLVFTMISAHFLEEEEVVRYLCKNPGFDETDARALYRQVRQHDYSPPSRDTIREWQKKQHFPICPNPEDPDSCNVYAELKFPSDVYEDISDYYEQKTRAEHGQIKP
jgi:DNA primase large subunit